MGSVAANARDWSRCMALHEGSAATQEDTQVSSITQRKASVPFAANCHFLEGGG